MRSKTLCIGSVTMLVLSSLIGCANGEEANDTKIKEEVKNVTDTSWYAEDASAICNGVYVVGKDMKADNYIFTATFDGLTEVTIFESEEDYIDYRTARRGTVGEECDALDQYALYDEYVSEGSTCAINVVDGNVVMISNGRGTLSSDNVTSGGDPTKGVGEILAAGLYQPKFLKKGTYILTNVDVGSLLSVVVFWDEAAYKDFKAADQTTVGEYCIALEKNALYDCMLGYENSCYINVTKDTVLMLEYGSAYLQPVDMSWAE